MIVLIDNYDSFAFNLVHYLGELGATVEVHRNDALTPAEARALAPTHLCISPGPGTPHDAGVSMDMIRAFAGSIPVLGVCLGAQQLAAALGGEVRRGAVPECGVGEVHLTAAALADPVFGPAPTPLPCVHWHGDTFSLPPGAVHLARSDAYENQAFRVGTRAYGLQFHVEVTGALVAHWGPHLPAGVFIRASDVAHVARAGDGVVQRVVELCAGGAR